MFSEAEIPKMYRVCLKETNRHFHKAARQFHSSQFLEKSSTGKSSQLFSRRYNQVTRKPTTKAKLQRTDHHQLPRKGRQNDISNLSRRYSLSTPHQSRRKSSSALLSAEMRGSQKMNNTGPGMSSSRLSSRELMEEITRFLSAFLLKPRTLPIPRWITPQHFSLTLSEGFGHASFIIIAAAYYSEDFFVLRLTAVAGSTAMLIFTYFHPHGRILWLPFRWNLLFIAINAYRIGNVYYHKFLAAGLSDDLKQIFDDHFYVLDFVDYGKLIRLATEEVYYDGDLIVGQGQMNTNVRMVVNGEVSAIRDSTLTYILEEGNFVSESGIHAGLLLEGKVESCCSLVARSEDKSKKIRLLRWDRSELADLVRHNSSIRRSLKAALSWDIVRKLKSQRQMWLSGLVEDPELWTKRRSKQSDDRYAAILQNMLTHPEYLAKLKPGLDRYRLIHHIDDEYHRLALKQCGWTPEEYQLGRRNRPSDEEDVDDVDDDPIHDWKWKLSRKIYRIFV